MENKDRPIVVFDIESTPNSFLVGFKSISNGKVLQYEAYGEDATLAEDDVKRIKKIMNTYTIVGFNSDKYDIPTMLYALYGRTCKQIFKVGNEIIESQKPQWMSLRDFGVELPKNLSHIDISEVAKGVMISLKMYGARLHSKRLQDLPYEPTAILTPAQFENIKTYNVNDLDTTIDLYNVVKGDVDLRFKLSDKYGMNLMSKSDAQLAEAILIDELKKTGLKIDNVKLKSNYSFRYKCPEGRVSFERDDLKQLLHDIQQHDFTLDGNGSPVLPDWLKKLAIQIGNSKYNIGVGGLHSMEKMQVVIPEDGYILMNSDVASYYPSLIIENGFYPTHFGTKFLDVYGAIKAERFVAKELEGKLKKVKDRTPEQELVFNEAKVTNAGFKILLNGSFGKLGSKYSKLYAPELLLQVTLTGQLQLLMLIERMEKKGFSVVSSNTDGIEFLCHKDNVALAESIIFDFEMQTAMEMENGTYNALYSRDVNSYVAVYDGYVKVKGAYASTMHTYGLMGNNREHDICYHAVWDYLLNGTPLDVTINNATDVRLFVCVKKVTGGAVWNNEYLGKIVRWYYSKNGNTIHYKKNNNKVAGSNSSTPLMTLPDDNVIPNNLDRQNYIFIAIEELEALGVKYKYTKFQCTNCNHTDNISCFKNPEYSYTDGVKARCPICKKVHKLREIKC